MLFAWQEKSLLTFEIDSCGKSQRKKRGDVMKNASKRICPECQSTNIAPIAYGLPGPEMSESALRGEIVLGGCMVDTPRWYCRDCESAWPKGEFERETLLPEEN